jgi:hypothetical protein
LKNPCQKRGVSFQTPCSHGDPESHFLDKNKGKRDSGQLPEGGFRNDTSFLDGIF